MEQKVVNSTDNISITLMLRIKAAIRPFITYSWHIFTICVLTAYFLHKIDNIDKDIIMRILDIEVIIIIFWFGERLARNIGITDWLLNYLKYRKEGVNNGKY